MCIYIQSLSNVCYILHKWLYQGLTFKFLFCIIYIHLDIAYFSTISDWFNFLRSQWQWSAGTWRCGTLWQAQSNWEFKALHYRASKLWKGTHPGSHRFAAVIFKIFLLALMQDASFGNFPLTLQESFRAEKKRDLGNKFSQFFFFFFFLRVGRRGWKTRLHGLEHWSKSRAVGNL